MDISKQQSIRSTQSTFSSKFTPSSNFTAIFLGNERGLFDFFGDKRKTRIPKKLLNAMEDRYKYFYFKVAVDESVASHIQANVGLPPISVMLAYRGNEDKVLRAQASADHEEFSTYHLKSGMNDLSTWAISNAHKYFENLSKEGGGPALFLASLSQESERYKFASYIESILIEILETKDYYRIQPYEEKGKKMFEPTDDFDGNDFDLLGKGDPFCIRGCRFAKD